jgi:uncharacterized protein DUF6894
MPRYYFHLENGQSLLDDAGLDLADIAAAQNEALQASGELLKPNGEGKTFFTLRLSAET